jgi:A118 family predicted phage portal protein
MSKVLGRSWLADLGYKTIVDNPMGEQVEVWWLWYTSTADFYESEKILGKRTFKVKRISIHPAKMVCEDWAALLFNERTEIGIKGDVVDEKGKREDDKALAPANEWLQQWLGDNNFMRVANRTTERAMALGTAGWALRIEGINVNGTRSPDARIDVQRYDARHIVPLSYVGDTCTECLFSSPVVIEGKKVNQLTVYRLNEWQVYEINTAFFNDSGKRVFFDGYTEAFDTGITTPPFALIKPGIDNPYLEYHPFGVSVFDSALGAVEMVDMAVDNLNKDIFLGQKIMFLPSSMLEKDKDGNTLVPRAADQQVFTAFEDDSTGFVDGKPKAPYEYNPDLRVDQNRNAIKTALELLGKRCGFGKDYYSLDERGSGAMRNKTATEVASDASELMRNVRKHEEAITPGIEQLCTAAIALAKTVQGVAFPDVTGKISIVYGDSIIEDDAAVRARDREDVAAGLMPGWKYIEKWQVVDEDTAKELWAETQGQADE